MEVSKVTSPSFHNATYAKGSERTLGIEKPTPRCSNAANGRIEPLVTKAAVTALCNYAPEADNSWLLQGWLLPAIINLVQMQVYAHGEASRLLNFRNVKFPGEQSKFNGQKIRLT